jgi:precorrin-2 dehydrogenase / sirohydrochlorin ferrochelatase
LAAGEAGALCCRTDGAASDFTTGAVLRRGDLCVAVSSGGASPVLAIEARDRAADAVGEEFAQAAELLGGLRDRLRREKLARSGVMDRDLVAGVLGALRGGRAAEARAFVEKAFTTAENCAQTVEGSCTH